MRSSSTTPMAPLTRTSQTRRMPRQGAEFPWITESNYFWDRKTLLRGPIEDDTLDFSGPRPIVLPPLQRAEQAVQQAAE